MKLQVDVTQPNKQVKSCLIIAVYENGALAPSSKVIDKLTHGYLSTSIKHSGFKGKIAQTLTLYPMNSSIQQIVLVGAGKADKLTTVAFQKLNIAATRAAAMTKATHAVNYLCELAVADEPLAWKVKVTAMATLDALYRFDQFKSEKDNTVELKQVTVHVPTKQLVISSQKALHEGEIIAQAMAYTKNLANLPSNICTPDYLANSAKQLAKTLRSTTVNILNKQEIKKLGMGAILAVSQGSALEPKLIVMQYRGANKSQAPIALVGKGVTFDTGGNSLKPPDAMVGMKYDMCGAATVLGTIKAAAELKLPVNIVGVMPAVENMPGGSAYKPEDIIKSMSGQTIEVMNTDAEGRLILADALTYCERYKPAVVIDIATLTGAVVIALGFHASGLLSNDDKLAQALLAAGKKINDRAWQLPLWDEYQEQLKSPFADMANTGGRSAGTITAGCFLSRYTKKFRWAHLDVAGTAAMMMGVDRYATGRPVPLLTQFITDWVKK